MKNVDSKKYKILQKELKSYKQMMIQAGETIMDQNVSDYPIMVAHQHEMSVGIQIADKNKVKGNWSINASTLEEFISKQLIEPNKVDSFKTIYKSRKKFICMFVLSELGAEFIFLPKDDEVDIISETSNK